MIDGKISYNSVLWFTLNKFHLFLYMQRIGRLFLLILFTQVNFNFLSAQPSRPVGTWKSFASHRNLLQTCMRGSTAYAISDVGLVSYDINTHSYREYTRVDGLRGTNPTTLFYDNVHDYIIIGYTDGSLDYFRDPSTISSIMDIAITNSSYTDRRIYALNVYNTYLYIATAFGVVVYDFTKKEIHDSYTNIGDNLSGVPVYDVAFWNSKIWLTTDNGLYSASSTAENLADPSTWTKESGKNGLPTGKNLIAARSSAMYASVGDNIYMQNESTWSLFNTGSTLSFMESFQDTFLIIRNNVLYALSETGAVDTIHSYQPVFSFFQSTSRLFITADVKKGLLIHRSRLQDSILFSHQSPLPSNLCSEIACGDKGELFVAPIGRVGTKALVFNNLGIFILKTDEDSILVLGDFNEALNDTVSLNFGRVFYDKINKKTYFGSWYQGVAVIQNDKEIANYNSYNSKLGGIYCEPPDTNFCDIRIEGIAQDHLGNMWFCTWLSVSPDYYPALSVLTTNNSWYNYGLANSQTGTQVYIALTIDHNDYKWLSLRDIGIIVFDERGTLDNLADDRQITLLPNPGSGNLPNNLIYIMKEDLDGNMWVGTGDGVTVFYNTSQIFQGYPYTESTCPVLESYCLLHDNTVQALFVDPANRKWIGTLENGVYLVNEDGSQLIEHFTTSNSPLPSNQILDIDMNVSTGEIFFATNNGLISWISDVTSPQETNKNLLVFPNPVFSDYTGSVVVRGSIDNASLRISTPEGKLIRQLSSTGGELIWDGRDASGNRLPLGVYLLIVSDQEGNQVGVSKIAFVERR